MTHGQKEYLASGLEFFTMEQLASDVDSIGHSNDNNVEQTAHGIIREDIWGLNKEGVYTLLGKLRLPVLVGTADFTDAGMGKCTEIITVFDRKFFDGGLPNRRVVPCTWEEHDPGTDSRLMIRSERDDNTPQTIRDHLSDFFELYDLVEKKTPDGSDSAHLVRHSFEKYRTQE